MMRFLLLLSVLFCVKLFAQAPPPPPPPPSPPGVKQAPDSVNSGEDESLAFAEEMPEFPGGQAEFQKYLATNIHYPDSAKKYGREGTVYIYFEVSKDGSIGNVICKRGVPGAPELAEEAIRVIAEMPNWTPGKVNGRPVKVAMTVPVRFRLN